MTFKKWNDLNQFHEVMKNLNYPRIHAALKDAGYEIEFGLKIKLHGTNACVRIEPDGKVVAQKRSSDIGFIEKMDGGYWSDNAGFATWITKNVDEFRQLLTPNNTTYVYGEWAGPGIQQGVACSMTKNKTFYIFSIDVVNEEGQCTRLYCPDSIEALIKDTNLGEDVVVVPWHTSLSINFLEKEKTQEAIDFLNKVVEEIGKEDPLIKELFSISGCGEGVVAYPFLGKNPAKTYLFDEEYFSWFNFKAKSEAHRVNKTKTATQFDPEKFASVQMFADSYCTDARFEQGFAEAVSRVADIRRTGDFVKWVVQDICKESKTELEANPELDWKTISKACSSRAAIWYKGKCQELV